ncbi:phosphate ABC transporter permease PstA [Blastochloris sulfoviridis]|uniref:Phosphate transport system permease protein PstA n=1 Tax=Blastochloris sulfoviridis TaxID=50712 RepID=A0A5M6I141_9HYPH|nr:phosphate ABC transporter permease PstA [Blastochloris sulfoviridis]KAA5601886.1 phosphate ABC transporter permease PstA [Blastochloris sulfoviridis]
MSDVALPEAATPLDPSKVHQTEAALVRLRARYRAEARFKAYGLTAVLLAVTFLAVFLGTIFSQGIPAFFQNYATLEFDLRKDKIDPEGTRDPQVIGRADYDGLLRDALYAQFPGVTGRADRRALQSVLSSGAPVVLRRAVLDNPDWIGTRQRIAVPVDDVADMFFKGGMTPVEIRPGVGEIGVSGTTGTVQLSSTVNNFEPIIAEVKAELRALAARTRADLAGKERVAARLESDLAALRARASSPANDARIRTETRALDATRGEIADLRLRVAELDARAGAADEREALERTIPSYFVRINGGVIKLTALSSAQAEGQVILPLASDAVAKAGAWEILRLPVPEASRRIGDREVIFLQTMKERGLIEQSISREFFTAGASREPEMAGVWVAIVGSFLTLSVTLLLAFPIGVAAALYLEEFAPKNRFTEVIEVNINNLAAVPSIIYGLLGLAVFLNFFDMPRSAPVVGGLVLALMTLPIVIIASRAAIRAVPPSIKEAALGVGASHQQAVFHHVLPLAMPGILTGTILGMAHALGETAPLLMIGMVAFVVDLPKGFSDAATLLPVQIFMWADFPELAFQQKTAAAIIILLAFLICMNAVAIVLRKRFERRW